MKNCYVCDNAKDESEFYPNSRGGRASICKGCHKARMKIRRLTNPSVQEYDRLRTKTPKRRAAGLASGKKWRAEHPVAYKAHNAVNNAVRDKRLFKRPCAICGTRENVHAHHEDYSRPLDVKWLCAKCHNRIHATFPQLGGHYEAAPEVR